VGTTRAHIRIDRPAADVWKAVADPCGLKDWFPGIETCVMEGSARRLTLGGGLEVVEEVVTSDDELRRFQYSITEGPLPVESHLATIDVIEDGGGTLVVYGCDMKPDDGVSMMSAMFTSALESLKQHVEG
jgi:uncharacterized protein YndB with AHSA1/START domain